MSSPSMAEIDGNRGPVILATSGTLTVLATIVVVARTFSKTVILRRMDRDDWVIIAATLLSDLNFAVVIMSVHYGTGKHIYTLTREDALPSQILRYVTHIAYPIMTGLIKTSLCLQYLRLFHNLRNIILGTLAFVISMTVAVTLVTIFECNPVAAVYDPSAYPGYTCIDNVKFMNSTAALSIITDIWIVILPIPTILSLKIAQRSKIVLVSLFSLGIFACIAGSVRLAYLQTLWTSHDPSWDTFGTSVTSGLEVGLAIIAASVPGTKPILDRLFPRLFPSYIRSEVTMNEITAQETRYTSNISSRTGSLPLFSFEEKDSAVDIPMDAVDERGEGRKKGMGGGDGNKEIMGVSTKKFYAGSGDSQDATMTSYTSDEEEAEEGRGRSRP